MGLSMTGAISLLCVGIALICIAAALLSSGQTRGQEVLMRVTSEAGRIHVVDSASGSKNRLIDPILRLMLRLGTRLTPPARLARLQERLEHAGNPPDWDVNRILAAKAVSMVIGGALGLLILVFTGIPILFVLIPALAVGSFYIPDVYLNQLAFHRNEKLKRSLPDVLDMLTLTLAAGIGFDGAIRLVSQNTRGPMSQELSRVVQDITIGKSRAEALRALAVRIDDEDVRRFVQTCIQADKRGTPFSEVLKQQSTELRIKRRQLAEERAQKVPIKILFPMMVCVLPVLGMVVMGPAIAQMIVSFSSL